MAKEVGDLSKIVKDVNNPVSREIVESITKVRIT
jgi:hypothetical protein